MTKELDRKSAKEIDVDPRKLTDAQAREKLNNFKAAAKDYTINKAKFYRECWHFHIYKLHRYFDAKSEADLLERLGIDKIGQTTFREACRVYKQFLDRVKELPEYKGEGDTEGARDYAEKLVDKAYAAVGSNGSYLGELARTKIIEGTKRETEENLEEAKGIYHDDKTKTVKDFAKTIKKKFGVINPEVAERRERSGAARAAKSGKTDGDKFMVNMRFDAAAQPSIIAFFEGISASIGLRTKYADMDSDELGTLLSVVKKRIEKGDEVPKDMANRKIYTLNKARDMVIGLTGVKFPDDVLTGCVEDFNGIVEPLVAKL